MKVGLIGLGRMGRGACLARMMKEGIEVYGYRRNYAKTRSVKTVGICQWSCTSLFKTLFI